MVLCRNCKFWERIDKNDENYIFWNMELEKFIVPSHIGRCLNEKFIYAGDLMDWSDVDLDGFGYIDTEGRDAYFGTGGLFGCIHGELRDTALDINDFNE
jgi:hypothetical protein